MVLKVSEQGATDIFLGLSCTDIEGLIERITAKGVTITKPLWESYWGTRIVGFQDSEGTAVFFEEPIGANGHDH